MIIIKTRLFYIKSKSVIQYKIMLACQKCKGIEIKRLYLSQLVKVRINRQ